MLLYVRLLFTMVISLFTARVVLNTLGVEDFGIYNIVGGFVSVFAFLNSSMASSTQRFLSFEIGKKNNVQLGRVFNMSITIHVLIGILIVLLAETIGLWFLNTQLTLPHDRLVAANWVYQFSIFTLFINVISVPYNAAIIARERMNVFAWVSIIEVSLKLVIVYMLFMTSFDKLKFYAILTFTVALIIRIVYGVYSRKFLSETKFQLIWDKTLFNTLLNYAGWNLWGNLAYVMYGQGVNILLNIFFGPVVNAARAIAYQIQIAINGFVQNFQIAINPQIIKTYASNDLKSMHQLVFQGARFSFYLLFTLSLPVLIETELILKLWLKIVPEYTVIFTQLILINVLIDSLSGPLKTAAQASGDIKFYQITVGGLLLLILPLSYLFLKLGFSPQVVLYISIVISIIALFARLLILKNLVQIKMSEFIFNVVIKSLLVCMVVAILPIMTHIIIERGFFKIFIVGFVSLISASSFIYLLGLSSFEKLYFQNVIKTKYLQLVKKKQE